MHERLGRRRVATWGRRSAWAAVVAGVAGCAQVLGLDGYGPEQDAAGTQVEPSDDVDMDAGAGTDGAGTEAAPSGDDGATSSVGSGLDASAGKPTVRDAAAEASKGPKGGSSGDATTKQPVDPPADATTVSSARDGAAADAAPVDGPPAKAPVPDAGIAVADAAVEAEAGPPGPCPAQCSGGCSVGICVIAVTGGGMGNLACPAGLPCEVQCQGNKACHGVVTCAAGQPCWVVCNDGQTCISWQIAGASPSSLCVDCSGGSDHGDECWVACQGPGCKSSCEN